MRQTATGNGETDQQQYFNQDALSVRHWRMKTNLSTK
jgi:hypothetical protein